MICKDYLLREIEKLTTFIKKLLNETNDINEVNFENKIENIDTELIGQFGFNLENMSNMTKAEFLEKINLIDVDNAELLTVLLTEILKIKAKLKKETTFNSEKLMNKIIILFDYLDEQTRIFSFKRMELKKDLLLLIK